MESPTPAGPVLKDTIPGFLRDSVHLFPWFARAWGLGQTGWGDSLHLRSWRGVLIASSRWGTLPRKTGRHLWVYTIDYKASFKP